MRLDDNYRILFDDCNVTLQYQEPRIRTKKSGKKEKYTFTENYYYPSIKSCLKAYCSKSLKYSSSIKDVLNKIDKLENKIDKL